MGCDIHGHVEFKKDGVWHNWSTVDIDRNYYLFAKMAGVRNCYDDPIEPIAEPRGVPMDVSETVAMHINRWDCDGHSHSWLSKEEMKVVYDWVNEKWPDSRNQYWRLFGYLFGDYVWDVGDPDCGIPAEVTDARIVFWFDN